MQVSIETTSGLQRVMTIGVPAAELEQKVTTELKRIAKGQKVNGFRKGKPLPANVAKRMFGKQARYEAIYQQMQQSFFPGCSAGRSKTGWYAKLRANG